eukprot:1265407-Rhodomonas_salina.2
MGKTFERKNVFELYHNFHAEKPDSVDARLGDYFQFLGARVVSAYAIPGTALMYGAMLSSMVRCYAIVHGTVLCHRPTIQYYAIDQ